VTKDIIKKNLANIRQYHLLLSQGHNPYRQIGQSPSADIAKAYWDILKTGPPLLAALYEELYVNGKEQKDLVAEWHSSKATISRKHSEMIEYLLAHLEI